MTKEKLSDLRVIIELYLEILINILQTSCALKFISNKIGIYGTCNKSFVVKLLKTFIGVSFFIYIACLFSISRNYFCDQCGQKNNTSSGKWMLLKDNNQFDQKFQLKCSLAIPQYFIFSLDIFVIYMLKWCTSLTFPYMILLGLSFFNNCLPLAKHLLLSVFSFH